MSRSCKIFIVAIFWAVNGSGQTVAQSWSADSVNRFDAPDPRKIVPIRIYRDFLLVAEGQIGGVAGEQNLVLDTGVAPSIINTRLARQLNLATTESTMAAVGNTITTKMSLLPELSLGPIHANSLHVQVQDLSRLEHDLGIPVAAIIGMDILSRESFRLAFAASQIEFGSVSGQGVPVAFDPRIGIALATVQLNGQTARLVVDTGAEQVVLFGGNLPTKSFPGLRRASLQGSSLARQPLDVQELSAADIRIGEQHFRAKKTYLLPGSSDPGFDGLLSVRALGCRSLEYDKERRQIYLQK